MGGEVGAFVADGGIGGDQVEGREELVCPAVGCVDAVLGDVLQVASWSYEASSPRM